MGKSANWQVYRCSQDAQRFANISCDFSQIPGPRWSGSLREQLEPSPAQLQPRRGAVQRCSWHLCGSSWDGPLLSCSCGLQQLNKMGLQASVSFVKSVFFPVCVAL